MAAPAEWTLVSSTSEFSSGKVVEHRHVVIRSDAGDDARLELAIFSGQSATLRVLDDPAASSSLAEVMPREHGIAGVNGGYFDPQYAPVGMLVSDGCVVTPLTKAKLLSGVVSVVNGRVTIQHSAQYSKATKPSAANFWKADRSCARLAAFGMARAPFMVKFAATKCIA